MPTAHMTPTIVSVRCLARMRDGSHHQGGDQSETRWCPIKQRPTEEKGQADATVGGMRYASREENDSVDHHQRPHDAADHAGQKTGSECVLHKFELQGPRSWSGLRVMFFGARGEAARGPPVRRGKPPPAVQGYMDSIISPVISA
jgi:hypothetical protein